MKFQVLLEFCSAGGSCLNLNTSSSLGPTPHLQTQQQPWTAHEPLQQQRYQLQTAQPLTISLIVKAAEEPEDYADYIADLGRNLDASQRQQLAD
ncbi:hypothetical protein ACP8Y2_02300 [Herpetosiphon llansteffanensis]